MISLVFSREPMIRETNGIHTLFALPCLFLVFPSPFRLCVLIEIGIEMPDVTVNPTHVMQFELMPTYIIRGVGKYMDELSFVCD